MPRTVPYGSWVSPISATMTAEGALGFAGLALDQGDLYWVETRPKEAGRYAIVRHSSAGEIADCTPAGYDVRTTVHEYGGGAFAVNQGVIYFANYRDQRIYRQPLGETPQAITSGEGKRYTDFILDHARDRLICIREDHTGGGEAVNAIVAVGLRGGSEDLVLAAGNDFYSNPRLSPDGTQLAYLTWNHPNMPWDGCQLCLAQVHSDGSLGTADHVAGGRSEAIFQPDWSPDGVLHYVSESTGWWNLYRLEGDSHRALHPMAAEFGRAMWLFGYSAYGFASPNRLLCSYTELGKDRLAWLDATTGQLRRIDVPFTEIDFLRCRNGMAAFVGGGPSHPSSIVRMDLANESVSTVRQAFELTVEKEYFSIPESLSFQTTGGQQAHAHYYAPKNPDFAAPNGDVPPLIVMSHGGPTSSAITALRYLIQYWTSRGFAVADVNYRGSTGYGRDYRRSLNGQWGVVDVDDCCNAALHLARKGLADRSRMVIKGRSAGGFTTFACLVFRNDVFSAGSAHFGVADLTTFTSDTHKFESHYATTLVGPYPERADVYAARSPINFIQNLKCALLLFQGDEDRIVLPTQSQMMFDAVRAKGLPTAYVVFQGEQHGFRKAESLKRVHEAEWYFFSKIFGFELPEPIEPIQIENLPGN